MSTARESRGPADEENAPLLRDPDAASDDEREDSEPSSLLDKITSVVQEPLTPLTKVLLVVVLIFLLLSSIFIGLFAGATHKLHQEYGKDRENATITATTTATLSATHTQTTTVQNPVPVPTGAPGEKACFSPNCIMLSASILSSLDTSYDPCEDFYDFANGGWLASHPLPADKGSFGNFDALSQENKQIIRSILESSDISVTAFPTEPADKQLLLKLRGMYQSCMDEDFLNQIGLEPLLRVVRVIKHLYRGRNPGTTMDSPNDGDEDERTNREGLTAALAYLHSKGIDSLFSFDIDGDVGVDPNLMTLWFSPPSLGLPSKEYYEEESIVNLYTDVIQRVLLNIAEEEDRLEEEASHQLVINGIHIKLPNFWPPWPWPPWGDDNDGRKPREDESTRAARLAKAVVSLEKRLAKASLDLDILYQDPYATYNPVPITNLTASLPEINFPVYFSTFAPRAFPSRVILTYPKYAPTLSHIISTTRDEVLEAYLITRAALSLSENLGVNTQAWKAVRSLEETLRGLKKGAVGDRSEWCVGQVESALGFASGRYFANETFGGASREKGTKVITDIIDTFKASLPHLEWMDKESADAAAEKASAIRVKVGYPLYPDTRSADSVALYYSRVGIDDHTFLDNVLSANTNEQTWKWLKLGKQRNVEEWEMYASTVNAYFNPPANEIVFPAGILQPPFFSQAWPSYLSYGSFGHVAAHELTHAFDSAGRLYNQDGKLEQWWTNATSEGFQKRQDCIIKQFSSYTIDDGKGGKVHVNGNLTSGENIGDTGLVQAYRAWKSQFDGSLDAGNEYLLPGLNYTREQLFFISFARAWAQNIRPESAVQRVRTDPHSPNRYRVDGTVYNIPQFAEAFKCSAKAKLNPPREKQCIFW